MPLMELQAIDLGTFFFLVGDLELVVTCPLISLGWLVISQPSLGCRWNDVVLDLSFDVGPGYVVVVVGWLFQQHDDPCSSSSRPIDNGLTPPCSCTP